MVALKEAKKHYLLITNSELGGVFTYDNPQTSLKKLAASYWYSPPV